MSYGWNIASSQACTKNPDEVRDNKTTIHLYCKRARNMLSIPGCLYGAKESFAHSTLL